MQLPLLKNLKHPLPVVAGIAAATIAVAALGTVAVNQFKPVAKIDLEKYTVAAQSQDLTDKITASGSIIPFQTANLSPKTAGRVARLFVEQGDRVIQGQKIAQMENAETQAPSDRSALSDAEPHWGARAPIRPEASRQRDHPELHLSRRPPNLTLLRDARVAGTDLAPAR